MERHKGHIASVFILYRSLLVSRPLPGVKPDAVGRWDSATLPPSMALLSVANLVFSYGDHTILDGVNLTLNRGDCVGLVGRNGCGKSTLMKLIAGIETHKPVSGQIQVARGSTVGYLHQDPNLDPDRTLREEAGQAFAGLAAMHVELEQVANDMGTADGEALEKLLKRYEKLEETIQASGGYAVDHRIEQTLHGLGLLDESFDVKVKDLSGGQRGRLALGKLLLSEPDLLLLDEPTNHLDIAGRQWLEEFLRGYTGAVMLISHDRWLLDRSVSMIYELELGQMVDYPGNYHKFRELKAERLIAQGRAFDKQQTYIKQQQSFIDRYKAGQRSKQARGREGRLERFKEAETIDRPNELASMSLRFTPRARSGDNVFVGEQLGVTYDQNKLYENIDMHVRRGDRIGVIGPNGAGKTTLVAQLMEELPGNHSGKTKLGSQVDTGWFRQVADMPLELSIVEYLMNFTEPRSEQAARDVAGAFLFSGLQQDKPMNVMSGGERARARLAALMIRGHNVLVLDEPTNHLDIPACERLEDSLKAYTSVAQSYGNNKDIEGTLILISHDRWLLDQLVEQLYVFDGEGNVEHFLGSYSEYIRDRGKSVLVDEQGAKSAGNASAKGKPGKGNASKSSPKISPKDKAANQKASAPPTTPQKDSAKPNAKANQAKASGSNPSKPKPKKRNSRFGHLSQDKLEGKIETLQERLKTLEAELADPDTYRDQAKFSALQQEHEKLTKELGPLEEEWLGRAE